MLDINDHTISKRKWTLNKEFQVATYIYELGAGTTAHVYNVNKRYHDFLIIYTWCLNDEWTIDKCLCWFDRVLRCLKTEKNKISIQTRACKSVP